MSQDPRTSRVGNALTAVGVVDGVSTSGTRRLAGPALAPDERPAGSSDACPCRPTLDRLGDRWSAEIIAALDEGPLCAGQLRDSVSGVSRKVLTQTLRGLERDGLVTREVLPDPVLRVRYALTDLGATLAGPLAVIRDWSALHLPEVARARAAYDRGPRPRAVTDLRRREPAASPR